MIKQQTLLQMLERMQPWSWRRTIWRRVGGKVVRFVNWRKAVQA